MMGALAGSKPLQSRMVDIIDTPRAMLGIIHRGRPIASIFVVVSIDIRATLRVLAAIDGAVSCDRKDLLCRNSDGILSLHRVNTGIRDS